MYNRNLANMLNCGFFVKVVERVDREAWLQEAIELRQHGDELAARQLERLVQPGREEEMHLLFCGHFSAGKSTVLNRLTGVDRLPSSPIPTSANAVALHNTDGPGIAQALRLNGEWEMLDFADLNASCRDGATYSEVVIADPLVTWSPSIVFWDTPGMDSTDAAHERITKEYAPLADVVIYICDYQHVLAETNRQFLIEMSRLGKPLVLMINQMDKHDDAELSRETFRTQIEHSLILWRVEPKAIFYISARLENVPGNEWDAMETFFNELANSEGSRNWLAESRKAIHNGIIHAAMERSLASAEATREQKWLDAAELFDYPNREGFVEHVELTLKRFEQRKSGFAKALDLTEEGLRKQWNRILQDARILPAQTRELLVQVMESGRAGFRVGLFSSKVKITKERERRGLFFANEWRNQLQIHLRGPIADWAIRYEQDMVTVLPGWHGRDLIDALMSSVEQALDRSDWAWIDPLMPKSQLFTDEFFMTCSNQLQETLRQRMRIVMTDWMELCRPTWRLALNQLEMENITFEEASQQMLGWWEAMNIWEQHVETQRIRWNAYFVPLNEQHELSIWTMLNKDISEQLHLLRYQDVSIHSNDTNNEEVFHSKSAQHSFWGSNEEAKQANWWSEAEQWNDRFAQIGDRFTNVIQSTELVRGRLRALRKSELILAVFGAFSCGKSTMINALLGDMFLPVSPHPTTAAIISIRKREEGIDEDTIIVSWKSRAVMEESIRDSAHLIGLQRDLSIEKIFKEAAEIRADSLPSAAETRRAYLLAVREGWKQWSQHFGEEHRYPIHQLRQFAAEETCSCFVQAIAVHLKTDFSDAGMVIVDTPGADSVFARHTELAYDMSKRADGIFYVCSYQHAFTKSDRRFLMQLAQTVKVGQDLRERTIPVYFLLNAVDLAENQKELDLVMEHLRKELKSCGFDHPDLFAVSARNQLRSGDEPGFLNWTEHVREHVHQRRHEKLEQFLFHDMFKALHGLDVSLQRQRSMNSDRNKTLKKWQIIADEWRSDLEQLSDERRKANIVREVEELLYYIQQRLRFSRREWFREEMNPSVFAMNKQTKTVYSLAIRAFNDRINRAWHDELIMTQIRLEHLFFKAIQGKVHEEQQIRRTRGPSGPEAVDVPDEKMVLSRLDVPHFSVALSDDFGLSSFKNAKSFFEEGGRTKVLEQMEVQSDILWEAALLKLTSSWRAQVSKQFDDGLMNIAAFWMDELSEQTQFLAQPVQEESDLFQRERAAKALNDELYQLAIHCNFHPVRLS